MAIYLPVAGVNTKQKTVYAFMAGVNTKMKTGYALINGVNTKVYSAKPDYTIKTYGNSNAWAGTGSNGTMFVAAEEGNHSKQAGVSVVFTDPVQLQQIRVEHIIQTFQEITRYSNLWISAYDDLNRVIVQDRTTNNGGYIIPGTTHVKKFTLAINLDGSAWGYYYVKPTFTLPDGSTFDLT